MRKPSLVVIFLTVFIDLVGFGIVLPLMPRYIERFGGAGVVIGLIIGSFSLMQFLFAPVWGRLSDRIGRRPVLLLSNGGSAVAYGLFALAAWQGGTSGLLLLLASRVFAGICGANISVASAYIADITPPEKRSKSMSIIGLSFGLGFIFGPAIGAFSASKLGLTGPGWIACGLCTVNFLLTWVILVESRKPGGQHAEVRPRLRQWSHTLSHPMLGKLIALYTLATLCFTAFETVLPLVLAAHFHYDEKNMGYLFTFCGVVAAITQGGLIRMLIKRLGDHKLIAFSLVATAASLFLMPLVATMTGLLLVLALFSAASNVNRTPTMGQISLHAPEHEQGATQGVAQSAGTLARCVGPPIATAAYALHDHLTFFLMAGISLAAGVLAWCWLVRANRGETSGHTGAAPQ
jgi:MFS family permease